MAKQQVLFGLLVLLLLTSCSTTKIHLFTQGVELTELNSISETLKEEGFIVHLVDLQPPDLVNAAMIYSPAHPKIDDLNKIDALLFELGYKGVDFIAVSKDNQSYTGRNIGLYLGKLELEQKVENAEPQFPSEFAGHCDLSDAYLTLLANGKFDLNIISWDESEKEHSNKMTGTWSDSDEFLEFILNESTVETFQIKETTRKDENNLYRKTTLTATQSAKGLAGCQFSSTLVSSK